MVQVSRVMEELTVESIYDLYGAPIYGVALKITQNVSEADEILVEVFKFLSLQGQKLGAPRNLFIELLRITIRIASQKSNSSNQVFRISLLKDLSRNTPCLKANCRN